MGFFHVRQGYARLLKPVGLRQTCKRASLAPFLTAAGRQRDMRQSRRRNVQTYNER